jgi:hypothetical protein
MTNKIVKLRDYMVRCEGDICLVIQKRLKVFKKDVDGWSSTWSGDKDYFIFRVSNGTNTYIVNLKEKNTCL